MNLFILSNSPWKSLSTHGWAHANNHKDRNFNRFQQISAAVLPSKIPNPAMFLAFQRAELCESFYARSLTQAQRFLWISFSGAAGDHSFKILNFSRSLFLREYSVSTALTVHCEIGYIVTRSSIQRENRGKFKLQNHKWISIPFLIHVYRDDQWMDGVKNYSRGCDRKR